MNVHGLLEGHSASFSFARLYFLLMKGFLNISQEKHAYNASFSLKKTIQPCAVVMSHLTPANWKIQANEG